MRHLVRALVCTATLAAAPGVAAAEMKMEPPKANSGVSPQIIGGRKVKNPEAEFPATLKFNGGAGPCTSTVVGPRVVLTAAHCVMPGETGKVVVGGVKTAIACFHHDGYAKNYKLDIALCLADADLKLPGKYSTYETLADSFALVSIGSPVLLLGYGCRQTLGGGPAGVLYVGDTAHVSAISASDPYIETLGGAAVCYGNSGGAAYFEISAVERRIFAVNSRGDILERSLLSAVADASIATWIKDWRTRNGVLICGPDRFLGCHA